MDPEPLNDFAPKEKVSLERLQDPGKENKPPKIRGALILVAACLFISLVRNLGSFFGSIAPIIRSPLKESRKHLCAEPYGIWRIKTNHWRLSGAPASSILLANSRKFFVLNAFVSSGFEFRL